MQKEINSRLETLKESIYWKTKNACRNATSFKNTKSVKRFSITRFGRKIEELVRKQYFER